ncbi:hypothetical protein KSP40_PGU001761 [Platanthera guangdongensis]|uniref:Uncharacterized protein n=1 Tax=Platanthera guangdongensis TaxID=2320717 RepID=A0ABR2M2Y5_9ASPA
MGEGRWSSPSLVEGGGSAVSGEELVDKVLADSVFLKEQELMGGTASLNKTAVLSCPVLRIPQATEGEGIYHGIGPAATVILPGTASVKQPANSSPPPPALQSLDGDGSPAARGGFFSKAAVVAALSKAAVVRDQGSMRNGASNNFLGPDLGRSGCVGDGLAFFGPRSSILSPSSTTAMDSCAGLYLDGSGSGVIDLDTTDFGNSSRLPHMWGSGIPFPSWECLGVSGGAAVDVAANGEPRVFRGSSSVDGVDVGAMDISGAEPRVFGGSTPLTVAGSLVGATKNSDVIFVDLTGIVNGARPLAQTLDASASAHLVEMDDDAGLAPPLDDATLDAMEEVFDPLAKGAASGGPGLLLGVSWMRTKMVIVARQLFLRLRRYPGHPIISPTANSNWGAAGPANAWAKHPPLPLKLLEARNDFFDEEEAMCDCVGHIAEDCPSKAQDGEGKERTAQVHSTCSSEAAPLEGPVGGGSPLSNSRVAPSSPNVIPAMEVAEPEGGSSLDAGGDFLEEMGCGLWTLVQYRPRTNVDRVVAGPLIMPHAEEDLR